MYNLNKGYLFAVVHVDIDYKKPARLGEIIEVATEVIEISHVTITLRQYVLREDLGGRVCLDSLKQFLSDKLLCLMPLPAAAVV